MKRGISLVGLCGVVSLLSFLTASPAHAITPSHGTFSFDFSTPDLLGSAPTGDPASPQCAFPITATWHLDVDETDYFYQDTGAIKTAILRVGIVSGTFSNPLTGKSVTDAYHSEMIKTTFAEDGTVTGSFENESRDNLYLHMAGHFVTDASGTIVKDVGRDFLPANKHPMDVTPLCDALS